MQGTVAPNDEASGGPEAWQASDDLYTLENLSGGSRCATGDSTSDAGWNDEEATGTEAGCPGTSATGIAAAAATAVSAIIVTNLKVRIHLAFEISKKRHCVSHRRVCQ
jgi:hypothetical protein